MLKVCNNPKWPRVVTAVLQSVDLLQLNTNVHTLCKLLPRRRAQIIIPPL